MERFFRQVPENEGNGHKISKRLTGTKEWAGLNVNLFKGCFYDCNYPCFAKVAAVVRRKDKTQENWHIMERNEKIYKKGWRKTSKGRIMFPSTHDITPETAGDYVEVLSKMLTAGNEVLITTKPSFEVIDKLTNFLDIWAAGSHKKQVQFRFTITSITDEISKQYEPLAPLPRERFDSLAIAHIKGFKTSISIEPFLEPIAGVLDLIQRASVYVTESIWIGPSNKKIWRLMPILPWRKDLWGKENLLALKEAVESSLFIDQSLIRWKSGYHEALQRVR